MATNITNDAWNYGYPVSSGMVSLGPGSTTVIDLFDADTNLSGVSIESGPVANQSFAGGSDVMITPKVFVGGGDYSTIYPATADEIVITANVNGTYDLESVGFGVLAFTNGVPQVGYFQELGYTNQSQAAKITPNIRGIGMPSFLWYQIVNLLYHTE